MNFYLKNEKKWLDEICKRKKTCKDCFSSPKQQRLFNKISINTQSKAWWLYRGFRIAKGDDSEGNKYITNDEL